VALTFSQKQEVVSSVAEIGRRSLMVIAAEYRGLTAGDLDELRSRARKESVEVRVVKNTLARRALQETDFGKIADHLTGPLVLVFSSQSPNDGARLLRDFTKENKALVVKNIILAGGSVLPAEALSQVAALPNRDQALAMLLGAMKAPIEKLARTFSAPHVKLLRTLLALKENRESSG